MKYLKLFFLTCQIQIILGSPTAVSDGGTSNSSMTAYAVICGGTTTVNPLQSVASLGSSGNPLVSNGASALPSFQALTFAGGGTGATTLSAGVIQSNASVLSSLGIGSANQVLKNTAGTVGWSLTGVLQITSTSTSARISTTGTSIPDDDTIPQNTEGTEILTLSVTPKSASSTLLIIFATGGTPTASSAGISALFVDSTASALSATYINQRGSGASYSGVLQFVTASGSTTARTYKIRVGGGDFQINSGSSSRKFGGTAATYLIVIEYI
ncbi:hypothetical protein KBB68_03930 [Candidatus Babeliales bacterium]|nr:hypothetical protein [Candidatus Babeliales bacterium]